MNPNAYSKEERSIKMDVRALLNANAARLRALYGGEVPAARYESLALSLIHI